MTFRISPWTWPAVALASPALAPLLALRTHRFYRDRAQAARRNQQRLDRAQPLELPALTSLELTVLVDGKARPGFLADPGVSYLLQSDRGSLLFDVGYGADTPALEHNARQLDVAWRAVEALAVSHLHLDHMGGFGAARAGEVRPPAALGPPDGRPCFLPAPARAGALTSEVVSGPRLLAAGIGSTGPLARALFFLGMVEEQALIARLAGKGLVVITGCGHQTMDLLLELVRHLSDEPLYALVGGLHFPITASRSVKAGIQLQRFLGTGLPFWREISDQDLSGAVAAINAAAPRRVLLSAHDSCDHALDRLQAELSAETRVLEAGGRYTF